MCLRASHSYLVIPPAASLLSVIVFGLISCLSKAQESSVHGSVLGNRDSKASAVGHLPFSSDFGPFSLDLRD